MSFHYYLVVPENVHTHPQEVYWKFQGGGASQKPKFFKKGINQNCNFQRDISRGIDIFWNNTMWKSTGSCLIVFNVYAWKGRMFLSWCELVKKCLTRCFPFVFEIRYRPVPSYTSATSKEDFKAAAIFDEMEKMLKGVGNRSF